MLVGLPIGLVFLVLTNPQPSGDEPEEDGGEHPHALSGMDNA